MTTEVMMMTMTGVYLLMMTMTKEVMMMMTTAVYLLIKFLAGAKWRLVSQSGSQLTSSDVTHILLSGE